jgi:hypothetical protein
MAPMTEASDGIINSCLFWKYMYDMGIISKCFLRFDNILGVGNL